MFSRSLERATAAERAREGGVGAPEGQRSVLSEAPPATVARGEHL